VAAYELSGGPGLHAQAAPRIGLSDFRATGDAVALDCVSGQLSGVTHNPVDDRWYGVTNAPEAVIEFDLEGNCLRRLPMPGLDDTEGLAWVDQQRLLVIEEDRYRVSLVTLPEREEAAPHSELLLDLSALVADDNRGLEGIAYDRDNDILWLVREKSPRSLFRVRGLLGSERALGIERLDNRLPSFFRMRDLSGLHHDPASGSLLLLSDESGLVAEMDSRGRLLSSRRLSGESVPQAEGVALSADGTLVVASEPNLLYVYRRG
jgi:uncharacterized protein YjiK